MFESFFLFASLLESQIQINRFPLWGGRGLISACHHKVILTVSTVTCPLIYQGYTVVNGDACWGTVEQPLTHSGLGGRGGGTYGDKQPQVQPNIQRDDSGLEKAEV